MEILQNELELEARKITSSYSLEILYVHGCTYLHKLSLKAMSMTVMSSYLAMLKETHISFDELNANRSFCKILIVQMKTIVNKEQQ